jgi:hypothetical protein
VNRRVCINALLLGLLSVACASRSGPQKQAIWVHTDGHPAADEEIEGARQTCLDVPTASETGGERFAYYEYAARFLHCMEKRGLLLVEKKPGS